MKYLLLALAVYGVYAGSTRGTGTKGQPTMANEGGHPPPPPPK